MNTSPNNPPNAPDPLAVALSKLEPAPHGFQWNALMFAAGRESKARALLFWRVVAGMCALVACGFAFAFFTQTPAIVHVERPVRVEAPHVQPLQPLPLPGSGMGAPVTKPATHPEVKHETPSPATPDASEWIFDPSPEAGSATRWLNMRNEVLTVGLSVLPDSGRKVSPPRAER